MSDQDFAANTGGDDAIEPSLPGIADTSAGAGTGLEGFGVTAAAGEVEGGTGAGQGTGPTGPGTTAAGAGTGAGSEVGGIGSGYGGQVTPGGPTGTPTRAAARDADDQGQGSDAQGTTDEQARPLDAGRRVGGSVATDHGWHSDHGDDLVGGSSMDSFPASDPPSYTPERP